LEPVVAPMSPPLQERKKLAKTNSKKEKGKQKENLRKTEEVSAKKKKTKMTKKAKDQMLGISKKKKGGER